MYAQPPGPGFPEQAPSHHSSETRATSHTVGARAASEVPPACVSPRNAGQGRRWVCSRVMSLEITLFTDPACPFAFSAEPVRLRLMWHYGDQLRWTTRMIVLTLEPGEAEKLAEGAPTLQRRYGMPIDPAPYARPASSEPACRAVVATRLRAPGLEQALLRRLRVRTMLGGLLDDPEMLAAAALRRWNRAVQAEDVVRRGRGQPSPVGGRRGGALPVSIGPRPRPQARRPG